MAGRNFYNMNDDPYQIVSPSAYDKYLNKLMSPVSRKDDTSNDGTNHRGTNKEDTSKDGTNKEDKSKFEWEFQLLVNVNQHYHFKIDEVEVKVAGDFVVVTAMHEEGPSEHDLVSYSFTRQYKMPEGTEADKVACTWSDDGVLTIKAPRFRNIPIMTDRPYGWGWGM